MRCTSPRSRPVKYDLGGVGRGGEYITVNLNDDADIRCDILNVERYVSRDGHVDEIRLSHTLEHIPPQEYVDFILALRRKLKCGGRIVVTQTDAGSVIRQWTEGKISFRAMRSTLFAPGDRLQRNRLNAHFQMWNVAELQKDFETLGFNVESFDAGFWALDTEDELIPEDLTSFQGVPIRNLGLIATKPSIPNIIHQTWKTHQIPEELYPPEWVATWTRMEGFEYRLWTDDDNRQLIAERHAWFLPIYNAYDADIKRVDAARYFILYEFGGIYADLDFVCLRPLDPLLSANDLVLCYQSDEAVGNAFMAASPHHPLFAEAIQRLGETAHRDVLQATGPDFLTEIVRESYYLDEILPIDFVYPYIVGMILGRRDTAKCPKRHYDTSFLLRLP